MALDEALLEGCAADPQRFVPALRLYQFSPPCLSLGYFQPLADVDLGACLRDGVDVVRRPTGGRAVLHDRDLTYAVVAPAAGPVFAGGVRASAHRIGLALLAAVRRLGVEADLSPRPPNPPAPFAQGKEEKGRGSWSGPIPRISGGRRPPPRRGEGTGEGSTHLPDCFAVAGAYELAVGGRKLAGSAQVRRGGAALQHGTLRLRPDAGNVGPYLREGRGSMPERPPASLAEVLGRSVAFEQAAAALIAAFIEVFGTVVCPGDTTPDEVQRAALLEREQYRNPAWTRRR